MRKTTNEQYIPKLRLLGYSEREIDYITTTGWILCLLYGVKITYRHYIEQWMGTKVNRLFFPDSESYLIIDIINESFDIKFYN